MAEIKRRKKNRKQPDKFTVWQYFKRYIEKSNIHGIKYLVEDDRHWTERLFWLAVCIMTWMGCAFLISTNARDFLDNKVAVTIDSTYILWALEFPAIHLCLTLSGPAKDYAIKEVNLDRKRANIAIRYTTWTSFGYDPRSPEMTAEQHIRFMELIVITSPVTLPTFAGNKEAMGSVTSDKSLLFDISQIPMENEDRVKAMSIDDRHCRFATETDGYLTMTSYSYGGCIEEHQMLRYNHLCGCVSHVYDTKGLFQVCDGNGTKCGNELRATIVNISTDLCMPECEEGSIKVFKHVNSDAYLIPRWATNKLEFNALPGPFIRYRRYTLHTTVDLVVAIGSAVGLFVGANILSISEIFYWLILRLNDLKLSF